MAVDSYYYWATMVYSILCCLYMFVFGKKKHHKVLQVVFKLLPLLVLLFSCMSVYANNPAPFHIKGPFYVLKARAITFSLCFSMIGDAYLVFPSMFMMGLITFLIAQGLILRSFALDLSFLQVRTPELIAFTIIAVVSISLYIYITRDLGWGMKLAVLVYMIAISLMLTAATVQAIKYFSANSLAGFIGALSFYCSDLSLAINKWKFRIPKAQLVTMSTYYLAQYLICFSVILQ